MKSAVSIVVGFKNRDLERIKNALDSIKLQTSKSFELIFVDYGSDSIVAKNAKSLVQSYFFAKYIYVHTEGWFWNRAHALNIGLKLAKHDIVLFSDVDLIFEPAFIEKILLLNYTNRFYTFSCFYLPVDFKINLSGIPNYANHFHQNYVGLCAVSKEAVLNIKGFDEYYFVWGVEDDDLYQRLIISGKFRVQFNANQYNIYHQWHSSQAPAKPSLWYLTMLTHFYKKDLINVTTQNWGCHTALKERKCLRINQDNSRVRHLSFTTDQVLLYYNSFMHSFFQLRSGEVAYIEHENRNIKFEKIPKILRMLTKKNEVEEDVNFIFEQNDILSFFHYFIGINRPRIDDYIVNTVDDKISLFVLVK